MNDSFGGTTSINFEWSRHRTLLMAGLIILTTLLVYFGFSWPRVLPRGSNKLDLARLAQLIFWLGVYVGGIVSILLRSRLGCGLLLVLVLLDSVVGLGYASLISQVALEGLTVLQVLQSYIIRVLQLLVAVVLAVSWDSLKRRL